MANSLHPGFIIIEYHSPYAPHKAILPTRAPVYTSIGDDPEYQAWDATTITGSTMVHELVDKMALFFDNTITWDSYSIWKVASVGANPDFVSAGSLNTTGTGTQTGTQKATQRTYTIRTSLNGIAKLVVLDSKTANSFEKSVTVSTLESDFLAEFMGTDRAWSGRDGGQPLVFKNLTITLNEKLRKAYHMA